MRCLFSVLVGSALVGASLLIGASAVWAHPDVVIQINALTEQLEQAPDNSELLLKRGDLYRRHQDYTAAASDFDRVAEIAPDDVLLNFYQGRLKQETGHPEQADVLLDRYLERSPDHAKAWKLHGEVKLSLDDSDQAAIYFNQAISLSSSPSPELYRLWVMALVSAGDNNWQDAMKGVDEGLELYGLEISLLGLGTDIALASGQSKRAKELINRLPPKLLALPQWKERLEMLNCLLDSPEPACQAIARKRLLQQSDIFMLNY